MVNGDAIEPKFPRGIVVKTAVRPHLFTVEFIFCNVSWVLVYTQ